MRSRGYAALRVGAGPGSLAQLGRPSRSRSRTKRLPRTVVGVALAATVWLTPSARADLITGVKPAEPQPAPTSLMPGLAVQYTYAIMNSVDDMKGRKFEPGPPILHLDWVMGTRRVLTSKANEGVGAILTGFLQFDKLGVYGINVTSNDGVRLEIGGKVIHEDPGVHSDTTSDRIDVQIERPAWYPITITYFQKRHTATLVVRWIGPGEKGQLRPVAPGALAHTSK